MNCYSHAFRFLDRSPYFVVGTCLPDWLTLIDRKVRVRQKAAEAFVESANGVDSDHGAESLELAAGVIRHHVDDHWFHENSAFVQLNLELSIELRELLGRDAGFRPHLAAHILIEVLLDRALTLRNRQGLEDYYGMVKKVEPEKVQSFVNRVATKETDRLKRFIPLFVEERYLFDYLTDEGIRYRLNRVLKRVQLGELPDSFLQWLPSAWARVESLEGQLLVGFSENE